MSEISKCENCGHGDDLIRDCLPATRQVRIICGWCQTHGPVRNGQPDAVDAWNLMQERIEIGQQMQDALPDGWRMVSDGPWYSTRPDVSASLLWSIKRVPQPEQTPEQKLLYYLLDEIKRAATYGGANYRPDRWIQKIEEILDGKEAGE